MIRALAFALAMASTGVTFADPEGLEFEDAGRNCIALTIFAEARGEPIAGQVAVAEVIRNRMQASEWPALPCDVVAELDQFHGFRDWPRPAHPADIDAEAWALALEVADGVMLKGWSACGDEAEFFFAGPTPSWARGMRVVCEIGAHQYVTQVAP